MSVETHGEDTARLTVDELAAATGMTVRTVRYYAGLGLIPPPERRGRVAYYSGVHVARLKLVRALQDHELSLAAIEDYLARTPPDGDADELAVERLALTTWSPRPPERVRIADLQQRAGRALDQATIDILLTLGVVEQEGDELALLPGFDETVRVLELDIEAEAVIAAGMAIKRHTSALAEELTDVFARRVIGPYRAQDRHTPEQAAAFQSTIVQLRQLTLEAVVSGFRRASNQVINRSLRGE